jgi:hypothetical protein
MGVSLVCSTSHFAAGFPISMNAAGNELLEFPVSSPDESPKQRSQRRQFQRFDLAIAANCFDKLRDFSETPGI